MTVLQSVSLADSHTTQIAEKLRNELTFVQTLTVSLIQVNLRHFVNMFRSRGISQVEKPYDNLRVTSNQDSFFQICVAPIYLMSFLSPKNFQAHFYTNMF